MERILAVRRVIVIMRVQVFIGELSGAQFGDW